MKFNFHFTVLDKNNKKPCTFAINHGNLVLRCGYCNKFIKQEAQIWVTEGSLCPHCKTGIYGKKDLLGTKSI